MTRHASRIPPRGQVRAPAPGATPAPPALPAFADPRLRDARSDAVRAALARQAQAHVGNHAVANVLARAAPVAAPAPAPAHFSGEELDALLAASPFFSTYIAPTAADGKVLTGNVHHHPHDVFLERCLAYLNGKENPDTKQVYTDEEAKAFALKVRGFHDAATGEIHIDRDKGSRVADLHEAVHFYAHATWRSSVEHNVSEGVTECLTRRLCKETNTRNAMLAYPKQFLSAYALVQAVSWEVVAGAYFNGDMVTLARAVEALPGGGTFEAWQLAMDEGRYADADALLKPPK